MRYKTILVDPPWPQPLVNKWAKHKSNKALPYPTLTLEQIKAMVIPADEQAHLWLWTTNATLRDGFEVMEAWGFKYLAPIVWIKPSGIGAWFVHRTQTLLFGYRGKLEMVTRFQPNILQAPSQRHSVKPECAYQLIEAVSPAPRLELFARAKRPGWDVWGNEVESDIVLTV